MLFFLSMRYNESLPVRCSNLLCSALYHNPVVVGRLCLGVLADILRGRCSFHHHRGLRCCRTSFTASFLDKKVPVLVGCSNALVAVCNLSATYFFPTWFQTVMLSSASTAGNTSIAINRMFFILFMTCTGLHLLPNSFFISTGSFFAG